MADTPQIYHKVGEDTPLTVAKRCAGAKEEALFSILKSRVLCICCATRTIEEETYLGNIHT